MTEPTLTFKLADEQDQHIRDTLTKVYDALKEKGYNPVNQIVGYVLSEDPTYITTHKNARSLMNRLDRDDILQAMVRHFVAEDGK